MKCGEGSLQPHAGGTKELRGGRGLTVAVNQPYIFPYLGYFQLLHAADIFVVYDDVQWINRGWINRNRVLIDGKVRYLTLPVSKPSMHRPIMEYEFAAEFDQQRPKLIKRLARAYRHAPFFAEVMPLLEQCLLSQERNVSCFAVDSLRVWCEYLGIAARFLRSSELRIDPALTGQERVQAICSFCEAACYVNLIGGRGKYREKLFNGSGMALRFVETRPFKYLQSGSSTFAPGLSIIDVAMNNSRDEVRRLLAEYDLVEES